MNLIPLKSAGNRELQTDGITNGMIVKITYILLGDTLSRVPPMFNWNRPSDRFFGTSLSLSDQSKSNSSKDFENKKVEFCLENIHSKN